MQHLPKPMVWAGMTLLLLSGFIHLISAPYAFADGLYKGGLLVIAGISALIAATGIQEGARGWGWGLGSIVAIARWPASWSIARSGCRGCRHNRTRGRTRWGSSR